MNPFRHASPLRFTAATLLVFALGASLTACGLGSYGGSQQASGTSHAKREAAEKNLRQIMTKMDELVAAYKAGNVAEAKKLADEATELYEGPTEEVVAAADPTGNRQLDPLLMATLPQKLKEGAPASDVESTANRAKSLAEQSLKKLEESG